MRIRTIKPGFFKNEVLAELPPLTRLLFQGLWCLADGCGRLEDRPRKIKAEILPYDEWDCERSLASLADAGFIIRYEVGGQRLIQVVNFEKHQRITGKEADMESVYPAATGETQKSTPSSPGESAADAQDELGEASGKQQGNNRETAGKHWGGSHAFPNVRNGKCQVVDSENQRITGKEADMESVYPAATGETQKSTPSSPGEPAADAQNELKSSDKQPGNNGETLGKHRGNSHAFPNVQEGKGKEREKELYVVGHTGPPREPSANTREELPAKPRDANPSVSAKPPHTPPEAGVATTTTRFRKPTLDEVKAYCQERENGISPERFHAYYEANGWRVGKNPMKDWRAAVRTWEGKDGGAGNPAVSGGFTAEELAMARKMGAVL